MSFKFIEKYLFTTLLFISTFIYLFHTVYTKTSIFADGRYYYSITRSIVKDWDIDFENDYKFFDIQMPEGISGTPINFYPPGVSFFWIFGFWLAGGVVQILDIFIKIDTSGLGFIYQLSTALTSIFLGLFGLFLVQKIASKFFSKTASLLATFSLFSTTNLLFYIAVEPINSHAVSFFVSAFFVYYFLNYSHSHPELISGSKKIPKPVRNDKGYYLTLGIIAGVAGLVRTQDLLILILPAIHIILKQRHDFRLLTTYILLLTSGAFGAFLPQLILWKYFYGTYLISPYLEFGFNFLHPQIKHVLFNLQNGLFTMTPAIALAFLGLFLIKNHYSLKFYSLLYFLLQLYLISSWNAYSQGGSYSIRMIITTYPLLSLGLAKISEEMIKKIGTSKTFLAISFFSLINAIMIIRYLILF